MRHRVPGNQLGRPHDQRKALLRTLATELLRHDEIITTLKKAKALQPEVEKIITIGKKGHSVDYQKLCEQTRAGDMKASKELAHLVHLRRRARAYLYDRDVVTRVFNEVGPRYKERNGGYTRIIKAGFRRGDATPMAIIQLV